MTEADPPPIPVSPSDLVVPKELVDVSAYTNHDLQPKTEPDRNGLVDEAPVKWYWGCAEAALWFFGALTVHLVGGFSLLLILIILQAVLTGKPLATTIDSQSMLIVTAGEMLSFVLVAILAVSLRYWGRTFRELNLSIPEFRHFAIVMGGTLPLSLCVSIWSVPVQLGWKYLKQLVPFLDVLDSLNAMEMVKEMAQSTPLPLMILIVALLPAIGEELVFRGAIGRVLIASLGVWAGVILTSILFGCIHIHPVHAMSVIPLGIAMHVIYLWTRSFWLPMILHFMNNSWASVVAQSEMEWPVRENLTPSLLECVQMGSALIAVTLLTIALWQSRVRWFGLDGQEWVSTYYPIRNPPMREYHRVKSSISAFCWVGATVFVAVCHLAVVADLIES